MQTIEVTFVDTDDGLFVSNDGKLKWKQEHIFGADWKDVADQQTAFIKAATRGTCNAVVELEEGSDSIIYASLRDVIEGDFSTELAYHNFMEKVEQCCSEHHRGTRIVNYDIDVGYDITFCGRSVHGLEVNQSKGEVRLFIGRLIREVSVQVAIEKVNFFKITKTPL